MTQVDHICCQITENILSLPGFSAVKALSALKPDAHQKIFHLLNETVTEFEKRKPCVAVSVEIGKSVESLDRNLNFYPQEYISLVGMRNLFLYAPQIIDDLRDQQFVCGAQNYEPQKGLNQLKDCVGLIHVLDNEFEAENDAKALKTAQRMIVEFGKACGLKNSAPWAYKT